MNEEQIKERLEALASQLFSPANDFAKRDAVKRVLRFFEVLNPGEFREMYRALYNEDAAVKEYDAITHPTERLRRLAFRLDDEGRYTDADICWLNLPNLPGVTRK